MKVVEVVDLLSSPSPPPESYKTKSISNVPTLPSGKPTAKSGLQESRSIAGKDNDGWFCLSDDSVENGHLPATDVQKPTRNNGQARNAYSWDLKNLDTRNPAASSTSGLKRPFSIEPRFANGKDKRQAEAETDVFYLSDEINTTIDLTETSGLILGPIAKRRKVAPNPASTKSEIAKGKGVLRSVSDVAVNSGIGTMSRVKRAELKRSKTSILDNGPVVFSSSRDVLGITRDEMEKIERIRKIDVDVDCDDLLASCNRSHTGSSSDLDLPEIGTVASRLSTAVNSTSYLDSKKILLAYNCEKVSVQKEKDKARKAQEKLYAEEAEKERRRVAKEDRAREKQMAADLAKVNALRIDKKISTPEMIVDLPADLDARLAGQIRQLLGLLDVECNEWANSIPNVIRWQRIVEAVYNEEIGYWEPVPKQIKVENHAICIMTAKEFIDLTMGQEGSDLDFHVIRMKAKFKECEIIYLIEGLTAWMRKNRNVKNRQFTEAVRRGMAPVTDEATLASQKSKKKPPEYVDEDMVEDALLRLQVIHGVLIHHTAATVETAQWVVVFTQHISTIPYRRQQMAVDTAFCMETGQVKAGIDVQDTFIKMLQEVNRVTVPIAYGIAAEYPSVTKLVHGFEKEGRDILQELKKSANKDGALTDREVGKKISRRLWAIFMGRDEGSTDI